MIEEFETPQGNLIIDKQLGRGKSGYSYLVHHDENQYVLKIMHNEPCTYYTFSENKVKTEVEAYGRLKGCEINIPELNFFDTQKGYLIKEYIPGPTASEWLIDGGNVVEILPQLFNMSNLARENGVNIDYFPTNFVLYNNRLFYVDYEINNYTEEWNLENWGLFYWANVEGLTRHSKSGDSLAINIREDSGKPITEPFKEKVSDWIESFS